MNFIKKWAFNKFAANDATTVDKAPPTTGDDLLQPKSDKEKKTNNVGTKPSNDLRSDESKEISKKKVKKLITIFVILAVIGAILGVIIYYATLPSSKHISVDRIALEDNANGTAIDIYDGKDKYVINTGDQSKAYWQVSGIGNKINVVANTENSSGDISFDMTVILAATNNGPSSRYIIGSSEIDSFYDTASKTTTYSFVNVAHKNDVQLQDFISWSNRVYNNVLTPAAPFDWFSLIALLFPILLIILMVVMWRKMYKSQSGQGADSVFGMGKSQAKMAKSNVKFSDVAGIQEEKEELIEIVDYLKQPEKYTIMGARTPKGVLLYGPPGTGKTLLARAVAGEAGVPFFQISGSAFEDMLVGVGAKRVRDLFQKARKASPAIIFIDEIDSVASKRGKNDIMGGGGGVQDQTINQLLAEMDGFNTSTGIVVMAATNRLDVLDEAVLRPGRFDRRIQVTLPDIKERLAILEIHSRNKNLSSKVNLGDISRRTPGFSGAQLENVLNEATLLAVRRDSTSISMGDIDEAIDRVIAGPAKHSRVITPEEKKQIAYHEAGHALVGLHTKGADVVQKITIIPRGQAAGYTLQTPEKQELQIQKKSDLLGMVRAALGGRGSEEMVYGPDAVSTGASNDLFKVTNIVRAMVMQLGMSPLGMTQFVPSEGSINPYSQKLYSEETALAIDKEIDLIIATEYKKAMTILKGNRKELDLIVETLLLLETIVKPQIDYIHKNLKLPEEAIEAKEQIIADKKAAAEADKNDAEASNSTIANPS